MGGVKNPFGGGNIGTTDQIKKALPVAGVGTVLGVGGLAAMGADVATDNGISKALNIDTSIKDPAGMNQYTDLANQAQQEYGNQRAFMDANVNPARKELIAGLQARANGTGPSIADAQLKSAFDKSLQSQLAAARSARGANPGLANRNASNVAAQQQQNIAGQAVVARMQEQNDAQNALQGAIANEQSYATGTLGSAMSGQANVAAMQNAQNDRNDKRNEGIIGGGVKAIGSFFGLAKGGMIPVPRYANGGKVAAPSQDMKSFASALKSKQGSKPVKLAGGGMYDPRRYRADTGDDAVARFVDDKNRLFKEKEDQAKEDAKNGSGGLTGGLFEKFKAKKVEADDDAALNSMVDEFDAEDASIAKQGEKLVNPLELGKRIMATAADGGSADDILEKVKLAAKKLQDNKYAKLEKDTQYTTHTQFGHKQVSKRLVEGRKRDIASNNMQTGGSVPGEPIVEGDDEINDTFDAKLSPGEVVIPRTIVQEGPIAAAYFTKKASQQEGYNAEHYKAEKKSFGSMLKEVQDSERTYNKVRNIAKKVR